jgi:hypothetical protein
LIIHRSEKRLSLRCYLGIANSNKTIDMEYIVFTEILQVAESNKIMLRSEGRIEELERFWQLYNLIQENTEIILP